MYIDPPKTNFEPAPAGTHLAILVKLIDLGWQDNTFQGETKEQHQAMLTWELPLKLDVKGRPFLVSKTLNLSLHEKATFRSWAENMIGRVFTKADIVGLNRFNAKSLLGKTCMIKIDQVDKEGKIYARIANLMQTPDGIPEPAQINDPVYFSLDPSEFDEEVFNGLSKWSKEKIENSPSYANLRAEQRNKAKAKTLTKAELINDEIPF
jgi:hypothetical protein